jgi:hypothetical protein
MDHRTNKTIRDPAVDKHAAPIFTLTLVSTASASGSSDLPDFTSGVGSIANNVSAFRTRQKVNRSSCGVCGGLASGRRFATG